MARVDIVIVNWNSGLQLADCVSSIVRFGGASVGQVVVVDNGSTDDSAQLPAELRNRIQLIRSDVNLGFGRACNVGAQSASSNYLLFLNPDARLLEGCIDASIRFMDSPAAAGIAVSGVRMLDEAGQTQRHCARFPGVGTYFGYSTGLGQLFPRWWPPLQMWDFDHLVSREVDHVIGAYFFVRRPVFEQLGGFDERFFVYLEDLDFSLRARKLGYRSFYLAEAAAFHRGGGTSENIKAIRLFYSLRSRLVYVNLHFTRFDAWCVAAMTLTIEPLTRLFRALTRGSLQEFRDTCSAYASVISHGRWILRTRHMSRHVEY